MLLESALFDTIAGLPLHPLVVHFAVALLPLAALLLAVLVFVRRWRPGLATPTLLALAAGTAAAFVAKESGEALGHRLGGYPPDHGLWGSTLPWVAAGLFAVGAVWWFLQRRGRAAGHDSAATRAAGLLAVVLALAVAGLSIVVGHSGATAVWSARMADSEPAAVSTPATPATTPAAASTPNGSASAAPAASGITLAQVKQHATAASCWAAVDGSVYDLTSWINRHPGGPGEITALCGTDASAAFHAEHGTQRKPAAELATFKIGALSH